MRQLKSIMLVDDDYTANYLHQELLMEMSVSHDIIVASNGFEALDKLHDLCRDNFEFPDVIFLDINMPGMNGFEFLEKFNEMYKERGCSAIVIMLTSSLNPADVKKALELEVKDYLSKPLEEEGVKKILAQHFSSN